jgi:hypothetical protein
MLNSALAPENVNKGFLKVGDLQRQLVVVRNKNPDVRPIDAANALLGWFQLPDNEFIRLDVLHYAISHMWGTVTSKMEDAGVNFERVQKKAKIKQAAKVKRQATVAKAVDEAMEQMVATLKNMTFKQARMLHGATANLDLGKGSDDQRLGDVFSDDDIRSALK